MLHRSFKPTKCKTSLKLATSRIKLMKNKKGVQINQMKRDLAQLLETGQDRTARIRVEHVIREEKMVAAYELIEIYCELIVARLPIIESQKTCPVDLKEAVTSVIFAAPRCSDISELSDIRKQFTAKYGKEFVSAAIELRPDCGVSRMLVEKLSAVAPDLQTKFKVLSAAAKEHNIEWDPTSFEEKESKPPSDLLNVPANIENASMANADPPKIQSSNISVVHSHEEKQNAPYDFSEQNRKYTQGTQNVTSDDNGVETSSAATHHGDTRSSGINSERMEMRKPVPRGDYDFLSGRQNWNMEFKDATSAAQAAAESAERAAMAARAAAQFSSHKKIAKQHPTGSHVSNIRDETPRVSATSGSIDEGRSDDRKPKILNQHIVRSEHDTSHKATERFDRSNNDSTGSHVFNIRDESHRVSATSGSIDEGRSRDLYESFPDDRKPKILNQRIDRNKHDTSHKATERFDRSDNDSIEGEKLVNDFHLADGYFEESLHEDQKGPSSPEMTRESETELGSFEYENINFFAEEATKKQPSIHSSTSSDELDVGKRSVVGNPFAVIDQGSPFREATKTSSIVDSPTDDEAISDNDDDDDDNDDGGPRFDTGFEYDEIEATQSLENAHIWSPRRNTLHQPSSQSHLFSESLSFPDHSVKSSERDDHVPLSFDHSDGPDSESDSELAKSSVSMNPQPSSVDSRKSRIELNDLVEGESSFYHPEAEEEKPESRQSSSLLHRGHELKKHNLEQESYNTLEDNDSLNQSNDLDTMNELNFGTLTGGLRNKGGLRFKKSVEESSMTGGQTSLPSSLNSRVTMMEEKKESVSMLSSDSDSDGYSNKFPVQSSEKASKKVAFFNDDGTDPEEVSTQVVSRARVGSGLSRRTRGSPSVSYSKTHVDPEPKTVISSFSEDRKPSQYSYSYEVPAEPRFYARRFKEQDAKQIPESQQSKRSGYSNGTPSEPRVNHSVNTKQEAGETVPEPKIPTREPIPSRKTAEIGSAEAQRKPSKRSGYSNETPSEPRVNHSVNTKQEAVETMLEPKVPTREPIPSRIAVESGKTKTAKYEKSSGENLVKKPSHVHPKLPDYDSLAARLQSLRNNDQ